MDRQIKSSDSAIELVAKTIPGEFTSLIVLIKSLINNDVLLLLLGLFIALLIPVYAVRVLNITALSQRLVMIVAYVAWLLLLVPQAANQLLQSALQTTLDFSTSVNFMVAIAFVLQFALPFLIRPQSTQVQEPAP